MSEITSIIDNERDNIKSLMMEKKRKKVRKIFQDILKQVNENNITEFYDFLGELLVYNSDFFDDYVYYPLFPKITKLLSEQKIIEIETYFLTKLCLAPEEKIITAFKGQVQMRDDQYVGRIYVTKARIIVVGTIIEKKQTYGPRTGLVGAIVSGAQSASREAKRKRIRRAIEQLMGGGDFIFFGHQIPINEAYNLKKAKDYFQYYIELEEQKKNKVKTIKVKVKVSPKKMNKEPGKDFKERRDGIIETVADVISKVQTQVSTV